MKHREGLSYKKGAERKESEQSPEVPVITIIRHGETSYKESRDPNFSFTPDGPEFDLDEEHLDLTAEGIKDIQATAERLVQSIDKDKEVVIMVTSPQYRAESSILIVLNALKEHGITVLNEPTADEDDQPERIAQSEHGLSEIPLRDKAGFGDTWQSAYERYREKHPDDLDAMPADVHNRVAASIGKKLTEVMTKSHEEIGKGFDRFLRHMTNLDRYLTDNTKELLGGRRIRIVCVTHEERLAQFAHDALGLETTIQKGQMIEIRPDRPIESGNDVAAEVTLFGDEATSDMKTNITIGFHPARDEELDIDE